jgi:hypothetical protein
MTTAKRWIMAAAVALTALASVPDAAHAEPGTAPGSADLAVRSTDAALVALIAQAGRESPTFLRMTETIRAGNGIVYVQPGRCGHGVRSCLVNVMDAGERRILRVIVDVNKQERELMGSIGHELRHAIEVLGDPTVRSTVAMIHFYMREATSGGGTAFETHAAIVAGDAVRSEVGKYRRLERAR